MQTESSKEKKKEVAVVHDGSCYDISCISDALIAWQVTGIHQFSAQLNSAVNNSKIKFSGP